MRKTAEPPPVSRPEYLIPGRFEYHGGGGYYRFSLGRHHCLYNPSRNFRRKERENSFIFIPAFFPHFRWWICDSYMWKLTLLRETVFTREIHLICNAIGSDNWCFGSFLSVWSRERFERLLLLERTANRSGKTFKSSALQLPHRFFLYFTHLEIYNRNPRA